jgi:chromosome segregation ATPase
MRKLVLHLRTEVGQGDDERQQLSEKEAEALRRVAVADEQVRSLELELHLQGEKHLERVQELTKLNEMIQCSTDDAKIENASIRNQLEGVEMSLKCVQDELEKVRADASAQRERARVSDSELRQAKSDLLDLEHEAARLCERNEQLEAAAAESRAACVRIEAEYDAEHAAHKDLERHMSQLLEEKRRTCRQAEDAVRQCAEALSRQPELESAIDLRERQIGRLAASRKDLEDTLVGQLRSQTSRLDDLEVSKATAEKGLSRLQRENDTLRTLLSKETLVTKRRVDRCRTSSRATRESPLASCEQAVRSSRSYTRA